MPCGFISATIFLEFPHVDWRVVADFVMKTTKETIYILLSQWLTGFELLGIPYLGKTKFKLFFQGPLAK